LEGNTGRDHVPPAEDVLHREPKVGERLREGREDLRPGLRVQGTWEPRGVGDVAGSTGVRFCLRVAVVVRLDPPSNDRFVIFS
jgi:hypothetical protein